MRPHTWLRPSSIIQNTTPGFPLANLVISEVSKTMEALGFLTPKTPNYADAIFTSAGFNQPINWRRSLMFTGRKNLSLHNTPTVFTFIATSPHDLNQMLQKIEAGISTKLPDQELLSFPGLNPQAHITLYEQGKRGGAILTLARVLQGQSKSIRIVLIVGEQTPSYCYLFDLVGAHPKIYASNFELFYTELATRISTALSTREITNHISAAKKLPQDTWKSLETPGSMVQAAKEFDKRGFFTDTVQITNLVSVPSLNDTIASQYSEGCFATWDPQVNGLISTVSGSHKPIYKGLISDKDLAIITGVREDGQGAVVMEVEGRDNYPPSSEAVELIQMDQSLPKQKISPDSHVLVPVARSKLHGHRGITAYHPEHVEFVPLPPSYYAFPVSCATEAQALAVKSAFSNSQALNNPEDTRKVVFTILPGHGVIIVEKWIHGKKPFEVVWTFMDNGYLKVTNEIPQGYHDFSLQNKSLAVLIPT